MRWKKWLDAPKAGTDSYVVVNGTSLKIADCNRTISLEFEHGRYAGRTQAGALRKLKVLRAALDVLEEEILKS